MRTMRNDLLLGERFGIVRRLERRPMPPHFPRSYTIVDSYLCDTSRFCGFPSDTAGAGYAFAGTTEDAGGAAVAAAIGEAVERYCGHLVPPGLTTASHAELVAAGRAAVDPRSLALFSAEQYTEPGFPCVPMTRDLPMAWADGTDLATGAAVLVPANLVWIDPAPPLTNPIVQAGLATGPSPAAARWNALREVIERDAMTLTWTGRGLLRLVRPPRRLARLGAGPVGVLQTRFYAFPNEVDLPVIGALVTDPTSGYLAMGMGVHPDPHQAMLKALGEAFQLHLLLADYDDPDGAFARAAGHATSPLRAWRRDRDYADAYRDDLSDVRDYGCHLQLHLDPRIQHRFETELATVVTGTVDPADLAVGGPADLTATVTRLAALGHQVISVDVTTADIRRTGLHVLRVLVPGYHTNSAAGLPLLGGTRLAGCLADGPDPRPRLLPLPH